MEERIDKNKTKTKDKKSSVGIEEVKKKIFKHDKAGSFYIERIPIKTLTNFKAFAHEHFAGDYGMLFKAAFDAYSTPQMYDELYALVNDLNSRLIKLENGPEEVEKVPMTLGGRGIRNSRKKDEGE